MDGPFAGCTVEGGLEIVWALDRQGVQRDSRRPCGGLRGTKLDFADEALKAALPRSVHLRHKQPIRASALENIVSRN